MIPLQIRSFSLRILSASLLCATTAMCQQFAPSIRIVDKIDESNLVTLKGNTHPGANAKNDLGKVSDSLPMTDMILVLSRGPAQQAAFDKFVASQYDSSSPSFHQWLTPEQVGENFGPADTDIATISNWLTGHGFTIGEVTKDHMSIRFSGTAGQVQSTFHTEIHNLQVKGVAHIGNMSDPQIPAALTSVVVGVKSLHNFFPRPLHHMGSKVTLNSTTGSWQRATSPISTLRNFSGAAGAAPQTATSLRAHPEFTINVPANGGTEPAYTEEDVSPYDFATIYNVLPLWNKGIDGTGQTIAIAGTSDISQNDISTFRTFFGLPTNIPANTPQIVHPNPNGPGGDDPGICTSESATAVCGIDDLVENSLDVEWSGSIAKNAQIILVNALSQSTTDDTLYDAESYIVNNVTAHIVSVSYGECELGMGTAGNTEYNTLWQNAAAEGIAVFVASGDSGSASCDDGGDDGGTNLPYAAEYGLSVSGIASTPYNTAVGGTDFNWCPMTSTTACSPAPHWSATNATNGASAVGYVPEMPWNDTCTSPFSLAWAEAFWKGVYTVTDAESSCNAIYDYAPQLDEAGQGVLLYLVDTVGGSGGASNCTVNNTVATGDTLGTVSSCSGGYSRPSWQAGVTGIPSGGTRLLPDVSFFASDGFLSDSAYLICVEEDGDEPCTYSTDAEPFASEVGGTSSSTPPMAGVMALIDQYTGAAQGFANPELYKLAAQQTYASCSAETVTTSSSCYFNDIDAGPFSAPGTNAMPCDYSDASPNCSIVHSGDVIGVLSGFSSGTGYDEATGLGSLNVYNVVEAWPLGVTGGATVTVSVTPGQMSINSSQTLAVTGVVTGSLLTTGVGIGIGSGTGDSGSGTSGGVNVAPTGTVTLTAGTYSATATLSSTGTYFFTVAANSLSAGTDTLMVSYAGDVNYAAKNGTANVTVATPVLLTPTVTVTPASATLSSNASLSVPVTVSGTGPTPTGTVTLSSGSYNSGAQALVSGAYTFTIPANSLGSGTDTLTVVYSGDADYGSVTNNSVSVTVTGSTFSLSPTTPAAVAPGSSAQSAVTVAPVAGYTGSVTVTCSLSSSPSGATDAPNCSGGGSGLAINFANSSASQQLTFTVTTTAPSTTTVGLVRPRTGGRHGGWAGAGGGAVLAFLVFLGIPARRRSWRSMLGVMVLMVLVGSLSSCGGGGGSGGTTTETDPGTSAGNYIFTLTGVGNPSVSPAVSATFTVTVN